MIESNSKAAITAVFSYGCNARGRELKKNDVIGVSLNIENYCTLRLFFDLSTLADLSRRNLPEAGIRLFFQI